MTTADSILRSVFDGDYPESPEIQPLSWLKTMIDECSARGPAPDCEDPRAFYEMIQEVDTFRTAALIALRTISENPVRKTIDDLYPADESGGRSTVVDGWHFDIVNRGDMFYYVLPDGEEDSILMTSSPDEIGPFLRGYVAGHELGVSEGRASAQRDMCRALGL